MVLPLLLLAATGRAEGVAGKSVLYVSPTGSDQADGTKEAPVASVEKAVALLTGGGTVILREGIYRQSVTLAESTDDAPLTIRAQEGERVVFDGGHVVSGWKPFAQAPALYTAPLPVSEPPLLPQSVHLWDRTRRVRYVRAADEAGVRAWSGSFCVLKDGNLLVHTHDGQQPGGSVECNQFSRGMVILRNHVTLGNLRFRNYFLNHYSGAISIGAVRQVEVSDCRIENASKGISIAPLAENIRILRNHFRDVGLGIANSGHAITVEDCLLEGASGSFAISDISPVLHCAIRLYHPGIGAVVRRNVTAGFHSGLRIKTAVNDEARAPLASSPFIIENNTFTDGISLTPQVQGKLNRLDRFVDNIYAAGSEDSGVESNLEEHGVAVKGNYRYLSPSATVGEDGKAPDAVNPMPFVDAANGNLELLSDTIPALAGEGKKVGSPHREVRWAPEMAAWFRPAAGDGSEARAAADFRPVVRDGKGALTLYVAAEAEAANADGSKEHPYPRLQSALDQVEPGDTVLLAPGVYTEPAVLRRGGTAEAPVTIKGAGATTTFLDGGRQSDTLLLLQDVEHVRIEGLQFRWFKAAGLRVSKSKSVTISHCRFFNAEIAASGAVIGVGAFIVESPMTTLTHCITSRNRVGFKLLNSPKATIRNNTGFKNLNTALEMVRSSRGSSITYNSFGFSSHAAIYLWEHDTEAMKSLVSDYNNFAIRLYDYQKYDVTRKEVPQIEVIAVSERYGGISGGKAVIDHLNSYVDNQPRKRYPRLAAWQEASGKDRHSLFVDPQYAAPLEGDFRLVKGSPNLLANGEVIGAEGRLETR